MKTNNKAETFASMARKFELLAEDCTDGSELGEDFKATPEEVEACARVKKFLLRQAEKYQKLASNE